ncbi:MAG TPA: OB-fold nucleic acid binding domain-containing protein, partial [Patescibacteria group bacterium]|nr:OB-fold nucleic acid binding domain-containing protein [Patescibacteria group bacterium]
MGTPEKYATPQAASQAASPKHARPFVLDPLFRRVTELPGIGPRNAKLLEKLCGGERFIDLLWHKPSGFVDRRFAPKIKDAPDGQICTLTVMVHKHFPAHRRGMPHKVWCTDETGAINLVFFHGHREYIEKQLPVNAIVIVSGRIEFYQGKPQMTHPDAIGTEEERAAIQTVEPVYPLTAGITNRLVRKAVTGALHYVPELPEWQEAAWFRKQ